MAEPVSLAEARLQVRIADPADTEQDALLTIYIGAARRWVEHYTGHILVAREIVETRNAFDATGTINAWPVTSVVATYRDTDGATQTVTGTRLLNAQRPARIVPAIDTDWPSPEYGVGAVTFTVQAGYANAAAVPEDLKSAVLLLVGHLFANRESVSADGLSEVPFATLALCEPYRPLQV